MAVCGWDENNTQSFKSCKKALETRITLAHRNSSMYLAIYTDASDTHWSGIVTQIPINDIDKPHGAQSHDPLDLLSVSFTNTQLCGETVEKEDFAIIASVERVHYMATTPQGFDLYTYHANLVFILDPLSLSTDLGKASVRKVLRWAVRLSAYNYTCVHIIGKDNVWADLLGRWTTPITIRRLIKIPLLPYAYSDDFNFPSAAEILK